MRRGDQERTAHPSGTGWGLLGLAGAVVLPAAVGVAWFAPSITLLGINQAAKGVHPVGAGRGNTMVSWRGAGCTQAPSHLDVPWDDGSMRRGSAITLGAGSVIGAVLAGALVRYRLQLRGPARPEPVTGSFANGMGYARLGTGSKTMLWLGGPSIGAPRGPYLALMAFMLRPFVAAGYSVWLVAQRPNITMGYTVADMAEDYAQVIAGEFGGKADLVIGDSTGGMIGFCLAARHAGLFGHIVIAVAGYTMSEQGKVANRDSARLLSEGRKAEAAAVLVNLMYPSIPAPAGWVLAAVTARVSFGAPYLASDVTIGAEAVNSFDGRDILPEIPVPVLMVCGDRDRWFAKEVYEETARLIPDCTLRLYPGKDHFGAMFDRRFPQDVLDFVRQHPRIHA